MAKETEGGVTKNLQERCEKIEAILTDLAQKCREDMPKVAQGEATEEDKLQELLRERRRERESGMKDRRKVAG